MEPWLKSKLNQAFPDPAQFKTEKEFSYAALAASAMKKSIAEILMYVQEQPQILKQLQDKEEGKTDNKFSIGGNNADTNKK